MPFLGGSTDFKKSLKKEVIATSTSISFKLYTEGLCSRDQIVSAVPVPWKPMTKCQVPSRNKSLA